VYDDAPEDSGDDAMPQGETLFPAVHWDHPIHDLENLDPTVSHELYYAEKGAADSSVKVSLEGRRVVAR
jgi:hypothetical protein